MFSRTWLRIPLSRSDPGNFCFEDIFGKETKLQIGIIKCSYFTDDDFKQYGTEISNWKCLLDDAIDKQMAFSKEYTKKFGNPKFPDYLKF
jgi:hypothetical protein